jgi:hypothetical protein
MRLVWGILLLAIGAAGAIAADRLLINDVQAVSSTPPIERTEPMPGDPPLVWIGGSLNDVGESQLVLQEGDGPSVTIERFGGDATRFLRPADGDWRELSSEEISAIPSGEEACIEALADGDAFLAVRVFLERTCAPA